MRAARSFPKHCRIMILLELATYIIFSGGATRRLEDIIILRAHGDDDLNEILSSCELDGMGEVGVIKAVREW